jgi:ribosomal protein L32E
VIVRTPEEIAALDVARDAAVIARTVGTRRRLVLEEAARKRGVKVLNPIVTDRGEE